jgi:NADPH:quinone reductase-like Zn-dependent oxidoreductase
MRAAVCNRYGGPDVLHIEDVEKPLPREDEVLVRIHAVAVTRADCATREANRHSGRGFELASRAIFGLRRPRQPILGGDFSGEVSAVGPAVSEYAVGDEVFGSTGIRFGAYAEFISVPESSRISRKPGGLSFVEAAGITDGGLYALSPLRSANVKSGDAVLVYGASGAIGTAGVQLAKYFGAQVTAVTSTKNLELVKSLGPDHVIDYTKEDFTRNGQSYDVIFDAVGKHSFVRSRDSLKPGGRFLPTDGAGNLVRVLTTRFQDKKVIFPSSRVTKKDLVFLKELIEAGRFRVVIDRTYALEDVVEAHRYVDTEQKVGNVILTVAG